MPITITATGNLLTLADAAETAQVVCTLVAPNITPFVPRVVGTGMVVQPVQRTGVAGTSFSFTLISPNYIVPNGSPNQIFHVFEFYNHLGKLTATAMYDLSVVADGMSVDISTLTPKDEPVPPYTPPPSQAVLLNPTSVQTILTYPLAVAVLESESGNQSLSGFLRLSHGDTISWRNAANTGDISLGVNAANQLTFGGIPVGTGTNWLSVIDYGADPTGVADSTTDIQNAINDAAALGVGIKAPSGTYKVTGTLTGSSNFRGISGDGVEATVFDGTGLTTHSFFTFADPPQGMIFERFTVNGPGQGAPGTASGVYLSLSSGSNIEGLQAANLLINGFPGYGWYWEVPITSTIMNVTSQLCGLDGFHTPLQASLGVGGTSTTWINCYANNCLGKGYYFNNHDYFSMNGCAADNCNVSYYFFQCGGFSMQGCGNEANTYISAGSPGISIYAEQCFGACTVSGHRTFDLPNAASLGVSLVSCASMTVTGFWNSSSVSQTYDISVDSGCQFVSIVNCVGGGTEIAVTDAGYATAVWDGGMFNGNGNFVVGDPGQGCTTSQVTLVNSSAQASVYLGITGESYARLQLDNEPTINFDPDGTNTYPTLISVGTYGPSMNIQRAGGSLNIVQTGRAYESVGLLNDNGGLTLSSSGGTAAPDCSLSSGGTGKLAVGSTGYGDATGEVQAANLYALTKSVTSSSSSLTLDTSKNLVFSVTLAAALTSLTLSNPRDGQFVVLQFVQNGTGGYAVTWPASVIGAPAVNTTAYYATTVMLMYSATSTKWAAVVGGSAAVV